MYLKEIVIEKYGPIDSVTIPFNFDNNGKPLPLIIIGKNGSGKTIVLSHIVNSLIAAKQIIYENCEVEIGKVYKFRSPRYIKSGELYSYSKVEYSDGALVSEWQLSKPRQQIEAIPNFTVPRQEWNEISISESSHFKSTFNETSASNLIDNGCALYFPSNRFEEPGWLNQDNLLKPVKYSDLKNIKGYSNRSIIAISSLSNCQSWLLDILLDRNALEIIIKQIPVPTKSGQFTTMDAFLGFSGQASNIYNEIVALLNAIFGISEHIRFGLGTRKGRVLEIMKSEHSWIPNLFQLSSGESLLLGLFLTIIRDFDLSKANYSSMADVKGIVVIDEIDAHLHNHLQNSVLPSLLGLFPLVQFVITTHSPTFLMGMERQFGKNGFNLIELPTGIETCVEMFPEFVDLFEIIHQSNTYKQSVESKINESKLPIVFVEGDYDIRYISKTIEFFYNSNLINEFAFGDGEGYGNLDKIWSSMNSRVASVITSRTLLLYDCDTKKINSDNNRISRRIIPSNQTNPIRIGIENLLTHDTINKLELVNPQFIDFVPARTERVRGQDVHIPETRSINKDEKRNICDWLCENGTANDFDGFKPAVDLIITFLEQT